MTSSVSKAEAAQLLGVSQRSVYNACKAGALHAPPTAGGRVPTPEVRRLARLRTEHDDHVEVDVREMRARLRRLEARVRVGELMLGIRPEPLHRSSIELRAMTEMAEHYAREGWAPHLEAGYVEVFQLIDLTELESVSSLMHDPHPWRRLLHLALTMRRALFNPGLRPQLERGIDNLYHLASVWTEMHAEPLGRQKQLVKDVSPDGRVVRKIRRRNGMGNDRTP